jgi:Ca2+-binding EF-hand superfamily protein
MPDLEAVFRQLDTSGDGLLSIDEMKVGLAKAGHPLSDEDVQKMLLEADEDWDGKISFEEFEALFDMSPETLTPGLAQLVNGGKSMLGVLNKAAGAVRRSVTGGPPRPTDAQLDTVFNLFDTSEDGFLDFYETKEALQKAGHPLSHEDCEQMLADVDCQISIVEFRELFDAYRRRPSNAMLLPYVADRGCDRLDSPWWQAAQAAEPQAARERGAHRHRRPAGAEH